MLNPHQWQQDSTVDFCGRCSSAFSLLRRRHHCRHCGGVYCSPCSERQLWLRPWSNVVPAHTTGATTTTTTSPVAAALSTVSSSSQTPRQRENSSFLSEASAQEGRASLGSAASEATSITAAAAGVTLTPALSPLTTDDHFGPRRATAGTATCGTRAGAGGAVELQLLPRRGSAHAHRLKLETAAEGSRSSAVGLTSSSTERDSRAESMIQGVLDLSASRVVTAGAPTPILPNANTTTPAVAGGDTGAGSRQAFDALFTVSVCSVSPTTVGSDAMLQTWMPSTNTAVSSPQWLQAGRAITSGSESSLGEAVREEGGDSTASRVASFWQAARTAPTRGLPTGATTPSKATATGVDATYAKAGYRVELDAHHLAWYLCRVCVGCYDALLDMILDAHEQGPVQASQQQQLYQPPKLQRAVPLWQYVRLCNSAQTRRTRSGDSATLPSGDSPLMAFARTSPSLQQSTPTRPLLSSAWARLCASVSLPVTPVTPPMCTSPLSATSTTGGSTGKTAFAADSGRLPPPALRLQKLRGARDAAQHAAAATDSGKAAGVRGLPVRLYGLPPPAALATAVGAAFPLDGSRHSSATSAVHPGEVSLLSVSSAASSPPPPRPPTNITSPSRQQQHQQRVQRTKRTPPRRRLISIGHSSGHVRQAVAIARRRRRIAVLLIDERDAVVEDACSPVGSPVGCWESATTTSAAREAARTSPATMVTPVGAALPEGVSCDVKVESPTGARRVGWRDGQHSAAGENGASVSHPSLSIIVDLDAEGNSALQRHESGSVRGLPPGDWLLPTLPAEAAVAGAGGSMHSSCITLKVSDRVNDRAEATAAAEGATSSTTARVRPAGDASRSHFDHVSVAMSRPISCANRFAAVGSCSTPKQGPTYPATLLQQQQPPHPSSPSSRVILPAVAVAPDCGACVLQALFHELGAATHLTTSTAAPVLGALTPTAAAAAAAAAPSTLFMDSMMSPGVAYTGWGTGPESYIAQRRALVREMVLRQLRSPAAAAAGSTGSGVGGGGTSLGVGGGNSLADPRYGSMAAIMNAYGATGGGQAYLGNNNVNGSGEGLSTPAGHERVTVPVNVFFQVRSPTDSTVLAMSALAPSKSSSSPLSIGVLPVSTQVELIGIAVDATAVTANTSPKSALSPAAAFNGPRTGASASTAAAGGARPLAWAELLPQLAKLSTNVDGYVVVVLRCAGRRRRAAVHTTTSPIVMAATEEEENPLRGGGVRQGKKPTRRSEENGSLRERGVQLVDHDMNGLSTSSFSFADSIAQPGSGSYSGVGAPRRRSDNSTTNSSADVHPPRRHHRVTDFFGGPQLRQLHQQLQCCGVAQPAISVIDVAEYEAGEVEEGSPVSTAELRSPLLSDHVVNRSAAAAAPAGVGGAGSLEEAWRQSPLSPLPSRSSPLRLLVQTRQQRASAAATMNESAGKPETLDKLLLPPSLFVTREPEPNAAHTSEMDGPTSPTSATVRTVCKREVLRRAAQEHAAASLRAAAHQLGLPLSSLHYPARTADGPAAGVEGGNGGANSSALLTRGLESLVATMVYRDLSAQR